MHYLDFEENIKEIIMRERYSRIPVYEETRDNVIGILNVKDLLLYDQDQEFHVKDFLRKELLHSSSYHQ